MTNGRVLVQRVIVSLAVGGVCQSPLAAPDVPASTVLPPCVKPEDAERKSAGLFEAVRVAMFGEQCNSVKRVLADLQSRRVGGGRKLHDKPFDVAAAKKELQAARADAIFVARLASALQGVSDVDARKVVEAAVLEDLGYFGARQLLVEELKQTQGAR